MGILQTKIHECYSLATHSPLTLNIDRLFMDAQFFAALLVVVVVLL